MISVLLIAIASCLVLRYLIQYLQWKHRVNTMTSNIASWTSIPFLGHAYKFFGGTEVIFKRLRDITDITEQNGGRFKVWLGPKLLIFTTVPEDIKIITNTFINKPYMYKFVKLWMENGIAVAPGVVWKKTIKRVHNAFSVTVTDGYQDVYNGYARKLVGLLKTQAGNPPFDASTKYIASVILEAICYTVMGVKNIDEKIVKEEYHDAFSKVGVLLIQRASNPLLFPDFIYKMTRAYKEYKDCVDNIHALSKWILENKRKEIEERLKNGITSPTVDDTGKPKFRSLLDNMLEQMFTDPTLTYEQVWNDADNFIAAGFETTSTTVLFILIMIGSHPEVQEKLFAEIKEIYGDSKRDVTKEDQERLKYTEAVVNETLRFLPVVPIVLRHADHDLKLKDWTIPQDAELVVFPWGTCQSRLNWGEDAREFVPERWFRPNQPDPIAFNAFSYGRRICIAKKSAIVFLKIITVHCVRDLIFKSNLDQLRVQMNVTLYPLPGPGRNIQVINRE